MKDPGRTVNGYPLRHDGWSPAKRRIFLDRVAAGDSIVAAVRAVKMTTPGLYQLRGFYEKLGYSVFGTIDDHPVGSARYFLSKRF